MISGSATSDRRAQAAVPDLTWVKAPAFVLSTLFVVSTLCRSVIAWYHTVPRYFPDEYIFASLGRSISHGRLEIHGDPAHFPALLEPILAAPLWRLFSTPTAYHLVQIENAIAGSLVVVPVYLLARQLQLRRSYAYLCCVYAVSLPIFVSSANVITDFVAYPLALAAVLAGVRSLARPTPRTQAAFLGFAALATFARLQYFVLVPAYIIGAAAMERRRVFRAHRLVIVSLAPAIVAALVGALGFYTIGWSYFKPAVASWVGQEAFLLAVAAGVVIVPGAVAGLIRPRDRSQAAFAAITAPFALILMTEVAVFAAKEDRFRERYLFAILPLIALGFGVYLERRRPHKWVVAAVAAAIALAAPKLPIAGYATGARFFDSQTLIAAEWVQNHWSAGSSSLLFALAITLGAACACVGAVRPGRRHVALPIVIVLMLATYGVAANFDIGRSASNRRILPSDLSWVDHASHNGSVTAIASPASPWLPLLEQLFWNDSIDHEVLLPGAVGSDPYAKTPLILRTDGTLANVGRYFLFDYTGSRASFANARRIEQQGLYGLYRAKGRPRLRTYVDGLLFTGWSSPDGRIRAWATASRRVAVEFTLSLPRNLTLHAVVNVGDGKFVVRPGRSVRVECIARGPQLNVAYSSRPVFSDSAGRPVGVNMSHIVTSDGGATSSVHTGGTRCRPVAGR